MTASRANYCFLSSENHLHLHQILNTGFSFAVSVQAEACELLLVLLHSANFLLWKFVLAVSFIICRTKFLNRYNFQQRDPRQASQQIVYP
jgi:hypothetical protein